MSLTESENFAPTKMIDLHTHILPDWDDGARDEAEAQHMVEIAWADGVRKIGLTPHVFRLTRHGDDLEELQAGLAVKFAAWEKTPLHCPMEFVRGAEVYVRHDLAEIFGDKAKKTRPAEEGQGSHAQLFEPWGRFIDKKSPAGIPASYAPEPSIKHSLGQFLTINQGHYFFLELPAEYPVVGLKELLFEVMLHGFIPIISHPERCAVFRERPGLLYELVTMGALAQVTAMSLEAEFGPAVEKAAVEFLRCDLVHLIASDAHDGKWRVPRLSEGVKRAAEVVGWEKAEAMVTTVPEAIIADQGLPDLWEPRTPCR